MQTHWTKETWASDQAELSVHVSPRGGPPLLFLHGVTRAWTDWLNVAAPLAMRWHLYALDFRGHGESSNTPGGYRVVDYVEDAASTLDEVILQPAVVVGHSLGAMAALALAARHPDKVSALILEDPPFDTMGANITTTGFLPLFEGMRDLLNKDLSVSEFARRLANIVMTDPNTQDSYRLGDRRDAASLRYHAACLLNMDPTVLAPIIEGRWLEDYDLATYVHHVECPTLLLQADVRAGGMLTDNDTRQLLEHMPDVTHVRYPGVGHPIHNTQGMLALGHMLSFLESLPRS